MCYLDSQRPEQTAFPPPLLIVHVNFPWQSLSSISSTAFNSNILFLSLPCSALQRKEPNSIRWPHFLSFLISIWLTSPVQIGSLQTHICPISQFLHCISHFESCLLRTNGNNSSPPCAYCNRFDNDWKNWIAGRINTSFPRCLKTDRKNQFQSMTNYTYYASIYTMFLGGDFINQRGNLIIVSGIRHRISSAEERQSTKDIGSICHDRSQVSRSRCCSSARLLELFDG
jgi:hypothetical protein